MAESNAKTPNTRTKNEMKMNSKRYKQQTKKQNEKKPGQLARARRKQNETKSEISRFEWTQQVQVGIGHVRSAMHSLFLSFDVLLNGLARTIAHCDLVESDGRNSRRISLQFFFCCIRWSSARLPSGGNNSTSFGNWAQSANNNEPVTSRLEWSDWPWLTPSNRDRYPRKFLLLKLFIGFHARTSCHARISWISMNEYGAREKKIRVAMKRRKRSQ